MEKNGRNRTIVLVISMAMMFFMALASNMYGTNITSIRSTFGLAVSATSAFTVAANICSIGVMLFIMFYGDRLNKGVSLGVMSIFYGATMAVLGYLPSFALFFIIFTLVGVGVTYIDSMDVAYVSDLFGERRSGGVGALHSVYAVGCIISPLFAAWMLLRTGSFAPSYRITGIIMIVVGIALTLANRGAVTEKKAEAVGKKMRTPVPWKQIFTNRRIMFLVGACFFNAGSYYAFTMLTDYLSGGNGGMTTYSITICSTILTCFNIGMFFSRTIYSALGYKLNAVGICTWTSFAMAALALATLFCGIPVLSMICFAFAGLLGGANYTIRMVLCANEFPENSATIIGFVTVAQSIGSMLFYTLFGFIADGNYGLAMILSCLCYAIPGILIILGYGKQTLGFVRRFSDRN